MLSVTSARAQPTPMPRTEREVRRKFRPTLRNAYFEETRAMSISERSSGLEPRRSKGGPGGSEDRRQEDGQDGAPHIPRCQGRVEAQRPGEAREGNLRRTASGESGPVEAGLV